ncbi:sulfatase family protein [Parapedobacter soli]|uniref:sulfatase family protein n=1 Tax=Parapedobacter soli TaxID=416955 RepID=UPI0021CA062C|nr:sulfatase [Parapedobacter soli]
MVHRVHIKPFVAALFIVSALVLLEACASVASKKAAPDTRPNILWIVADDLGTDLACYGTPSVQTPNLDRFASEGVTYTHMFSVAAVCSPSRSALVTGMYPVSINSHQHRARTKDSLPENIHPISAYFRQQGYFVTNGSGGNMASNGKTDYNFAHQPKQLYDGSDWRQRTAGQPFFAQVQIKYPHRPFVTDSINPVDPDRVQLPPYYPNTPLARKDWAMYLETVQLTDRYVGEILQRLEEDGLADNTIVFFFGDQGRPHVRSKQFLYDGGIHTPLIIRFPGMPNAGEKTERMVSTIDIAATSLALAGIPIPEGMQGVDFLDSTVPPRVYTFSMRDRCDETVDRIRAVRSHRFKYIRNFYPERPYTQFNAYKKLNYPVLTQLQVMRSHGQLNESQQRFMADVRPPEELYDLLADPHELHNLASSTSFQDTLEHYRGVLDWWLIEADHGVYPEPAEEIEYATNMMQENFESGMEKKGLAPTISDEEFLEYWKRELGVIQ